MPVRLTGSLKEFVGRFDELVEDFYREHGPDWSSDNFRKGPCIYFHRATVQYVRQQTRPFAEWLPHDLRFHELLYATLTAWGMNATNEGGPKLKDFDEFRRAVSCLGSMNALEQCRHIELEQLTHGCRPLVEELFDVLRDDERGKIMRSSSVTVASSKLLHHLLPDLFPPIDRNFTASALNRFDDENKLPGDWDTFATFWHIVAFFRKVVCAKTSNAIRRRWMNGDARYPMNTSIPKIVDNALIAYSNALYPEG